ncbi:MAG: polysaccharide biosynthesis C-terminal domain-containing protein [Ruminococcus sp.]|nr:polysaccharide biosynthesis C-terminal domain-containing protein [Ruminococcus sp.]
MAAEKKASYKKLFSNTLIFALGSFSSKILVLLLVNVYTTYLTPEEMGINDVIQQISNWMLPIVTMTISESILRFGLDKAYDKRKVFTIGNLACLAGFAVLAIVLPIVTVSGVADKYLQGYSLLIYVYIVAAAMKQVYSYFLRALEKVKLYAINSILTTLLTLVGTILFICVFHMGNTGYLFSIILSDMISTVFMTIAAKLWRYYDFKHIDREMVRTMLSYCVPLIPAQIMWLITNSSDSFMTTYYLGSDRNGILSASYKIANLVSTVYLMFGQAWNMSAILEDDSDDRNEFYGNVFNLNQCLLYILAAGCLMLCKPITQIWMGESFQESAMYSPLLIYSTIFSCFTTFMGSIYLSSKKTKRSMVTAMIAGVINVAFNLFLIPRIGIFGATISTVVSYVVVFIVRAYDSRKIINFNLRIPKLIINNILLLFMTLVSVFQHKSEAVSRAAIVVLPIMFVVITVMNIRPVWKAAMAILPKKIVTVINRIGIPRLIALVCALAAFAVVCWFYPIVLKAACLAIFCALCSYGIVRSKEPIKLTGGIGIFITVWICANLPTAFLVMLVLSAMEYLRKPSGVTCAIGCISLVGMIWDIFSALTGAFCALVILLAAVVKNVDRIKALMEKLLDKISSSKHIDIN